MIRQREDGTYEIALVNIFTSINGEGYNSGKLTTFIRTFGCNLRCIYCDTKESWNEENMSKIYPERTGDNLVWKSAQEIFDEVEELEKNWKQKSICLTGGEPLQVTNKEFMLEDLLPLFVNAHYDVGIETNGAVDYAPYKEKFGNAKVVNSFGDREGITIISDYKLPCSHMTKFMLNSNFALYSEEDLVKMVISDNDKDWEELNRVINIPTKASFYLSPCFGEVTMNKIPEYIMNHADKNIRAQIQIHKIFWEPTKKDV